MNDTIPTYQLGTKVRDVITQVVGILTARIEFINGCVQYAITQPVQPDGKVPDSHWIDHQRIQVVDAGVTAHFESRDAGGPAETRSANYSG